MSTDDPDAEDLAEAFPHVAQLEQELKEADASVEELAEQGGTTRRDLLAGSAGLLGLGGILTAGSGTAAAGDDQVGSLGTDGNRLDAEIEDLDLTDQSSTPAGPGSGQVRFYAKNGSLYYKPAGGSETQLGGGGGTGIFEDTNSDGIYEQTTGSGIEVPSVNTGELNIKNRVYDLREFGVVSDGSTSDPTDNRAAIENAIETAAADNRDLIIPAGDYFYERPIDLQGLSNVRVIGTWDSILRRDDEPDTGLTHNFMLTDCTGVDLIGFRHLGDPNTSSKQQGIEINEGCENCRAERLLMEDWGGDAVGVYTSSSATPAPEDCDVVDCVVINSGDDGINVGSNNGCIGGEFAGNLVLDPNGRTNDGIHVSINARQASIHNNRVVGTDTGVGLYECYQNQIHGNRLVDNRTYGVHSKSGDTSTNYDNEIENNTIIRADGTGIRITHGEGHAIDGNTIRGDGTTNVGIYLQAPKTSIRSNTLSGLGSEGIQLSIGSATDMHSAVTGNEILGSVSGSGIDLYNAQYCTITSNVLESEDISENGDYNRVADNIAPGGVTVSGANSTSGGNIS